MDTGPDTVIDELSVEECLDLLRGEDVGRLGVVVDGQPLIFPVNHLVDDGVVVFRTDQGAKLAGASLAKVAFEVDRIDEERRLGWSVLVVGRGFDVTDTVDERSVVLRRLPVAPWAGGERAHWVKIVAAATTGRRIRPRS